MTAFLTWPYLATGRSVARTAPDRAADIINVAEYVTLVGDGVTDNYAAVESFKDMMKTVGKTFPATVTMTLANPAVITWTSHRLRVNEAVVFSTTGTLPVTAGLTYYVLSAGLTANTFRISTLNAAIDFTGEGTAVDTSLGSQSGTHSCQVQGADWQNIVLPPGNYHVSTNAHIVGNQRRLRLWAYGAACDNLVFANRNMGYDFATNTYTNSALVATVKAHNHGGDNVITLLTLGDVSKFQVGGWIVVAALDTQGIYGDPQGWPPNNHYFEFVKISAIDTGTGVISLETELRNSYKSTYPAFWVGDGSNPSLGGPATIYPMPSTWDMEVEVRGLRSINESGGPGGSGLNCCIRRIKFIDCVFNADGPVPTVNKEFIAERCTWGVDRPLYLGFVEPDKLVEYCAFKECNIYKLMSQSSAVDRMVVDSSVIEQMNGTVKNTHIKNSDIAALTVGPLAFGATENLLIENSRIGTIAASPRLDDALQVAPFQNCVSNFTFVGGTLKQAIATTRANQWAVPGRKMYVNDMAGVYANMGAPFTILDVYDDGTNICIDTDLTSMPVGNSTSATITMTQASPAVVTWTSHGLIAGTPVRFKTTGALLTNAADNVLYYVLAAGLGASAFEFSTSVGGAAVNTTGTQSGVHTGVSNPLHFQPHPASRVTVTNCTGCPSIVDLSNGPDNVPLFSYASRRYVGGKGTSLIYTTHPYVWGKIVSLTINVKRAYTGATGTFTMAITANCFDDAQLAGNLSLTINLKTAGLRTITQTAATGSQSGDTIAAFSNWSSGQLSVVYSSDIPSDTLEKSPIVELEIETDQGYTNTMVIEYGAQGELPILITDTQTPSMW